MKLKRLPPLILAAVLLSAVFTACSKAPVINADVPVSQNPSAIPTVSSDLVDVKLAADYAEVFAAINESITSGRGTYYGTAEMAGAVDDAAPVPSAAPQEAGSNSGTAASPDYSGTNVQVAGIDEGDIVKTDGKYIYVLSASELKIVKTAGAESRLISSTKVGEDYVYDDSTSESVSKTPIELYVAGDRVVVVSGYYRWQSWEGSDGVWTYDEDQVVYLDIYNVSDPAAPRLEHSLGQDGYTIASRMVDGNVYLVTGYNVYDPVEGQPETFVPCVYDDADKSLVEARDIVIPPGISGTSYTVASVFDIENGSRSATQTLLGGGNTVYMNENSLYVARSVYDSTQSDPYMDGVYTVVDYKDRARVEISRFDISGGGLSLGATGSVDGYLVNQFAMDEYKGNLRVVTTLSGNNYSIYTDERMGFENWVQGDDYAATNSLYVLDSGMNLIGSITGLAETEHVYSVRFDGDIGYFVTFWQTDPLFAVDLSDPRSPSVLSALKIPGFSEYLHVYGEGRLLGLGMEADEETGVTDGMKLTMFDTSDPANVSEKWTLKLSSNWSEALYNHKAILVSPEKNLIAFPVDSGYDVYGYSDENGFQLRGHFDTDEWSYYMRGLYIDNYIYICSDFGVTIVTLDSLSAAGYVGF